MSQNPFIKKSDLENQISFFNIMDVLSYFYIRMQKQDFFSKQKVSNAAFSWGIIRQQNKKSNSSAWWIFLVIVLIILWAWYYYKDVIFNQEIEPEIQSEYVIWSIIEQEWTLTADWDLLNYTHTLTTAEGKKYLLKSKTIAMNNLDTSSTWTFYVVGSIESVFQELPLVEVTTITSLNKNEEVSPITEEISNQAVYVAKAWLGFTSNFYDYYAFVGNPWDNWEITVQNIDTLKTTTISYFNCSNEEGDKNCNQLTNAFNANAVRKVPSINWDMFYKLSEVQSWFFQNNNWWGYFINDSDDTEVDNIRNFIILPNNNIISDIVNRYGIRTCLWNDQWTYTITSHKANKTSDGIKVTINWKWDKDFECETLVDLSEPTWLKFVDIKVVEKKAEEETAPTEENKETENKNESNNEQKIIAVDSQLPVTPSEKQFPINMEKAMTYNSARWGYAMILPSWNISYTAWLAEQEYDDWKIRCNYATKVIQYKNKEELETNPSVIVHECKIKDGAVVPWDNYYIKELWDQKFLVEIRDPAWFDFAKNIQIESLSQE